MPTLRQSLVSRLTRLYPLYSGCGSFANKPLIHRLAGESAERVWSKVPGGEVLAPLDDYVGRAAFYVGDLDRKITWVCGRIARPGDTVLDIGANIGLVSLWLSRLVGEQGQVHAFEPNPALQALLGQMFAHNGLRNVHLHRVALGAQDGALELRIPKVNAGAASFVRNRDVSDCEVVVAPIRTLSGIVEEQGIRHIRLIKIDVEGFEAEVFKGGLDVLQRIQPEAILFELNDTISGALAEQPVIKILSECGYRFFSIPRSLLKMRLEPFEPDVTPLVGHDFLAVPKGEAYDRIGRLVNAF